MKTILAAGIAALAIPASAKTELQWWHAMGGRLGEVVDEIAKTTMLAKVNTRLFQHIKVVMKTQ